MDLTMWRSALIVVLLAAASHGAEAEKRLFSFEKDEVAKLGAKFKSASDTRYVTDKFGYYKNVGTGSTEHATHGKWSLEKTIVDRYNFLSKGNKTIYYEQVRAGRVLGTWGWFRKAFGADWSGYDMLRIDVRTSGPTVRLRVEVEDESFPIPMVRIFKVPGGKWVTLEVDLVVFAKAHLLDLPKMAQLTVLAVERLDGERPFKIWLDNVRLAKRDAKSTLPLVRDKSKMQAPSRTRGEEVFLKPLDISKTTPAAGVVGTIPIKRKPSYDLMQVMERAVGGFGKGGIVVVNGPNACLSLDAGKTWTGLDGKGASTLLSRDHRGHHRATATIAGDDIYTAFCSNRCAGGGGRTRNHFVAAGHNGVAWTVGHEIVIETGARHCTQRFSITKDTSGWVWCAWMHTGRLGGEVRAKFSSDAEGWCDAGSNGRIGQGGTAGPYLTSFGDGVICVWRRGQEALVWSQARRVKVKVKSARKDCSMTLAAGAKQGVRFRSAFIHWDKWLGQNAYRVVEVRPAEAEVLLWNGLSFPDRLAPDDSVTGVTWTKPQVLSKKARNASVATAKDGALHVLLTYKRAPAEVRRFDGKTWTTDTPPDLTRSDRPPLLVACGGMMGCVWSAKGKIMLALKPDGGKWWPAKQVAEEKEKIVSMAAPQKAPDTFIPIAWSTSSRKFIKVVAAPVKQPEEKREIPDIP
jgi:hypothetical protein